MNEEKYEIGRPRGKVVETVREASEHHMRFCEVSNTYYACSEMKRLSEPSERWLQELEEARGKLLRVMILEGMIAAVFPWGTIILPAELR